MVTRRKRDVLEIKTADVLCNFSEGDACICGGKGFAPDDASLLEPFVRLAQLDRIPVRCLKIEYS